MSLASTAHGRHFRLTSVQVDYKVYGPAIQAGKDQVVLDGEKERQGDFVFTANQVGEYRFCFDNSMSTMTDKLVDFEIAVRCSPPAHGDLGAMP